ncbi:MAG: arginine decarboxylase, pyruvoyl-dependent [Candidatus Moranbacteria bacterium]|nr:arginine decarboxylase, pyruvoyl-dependent [Candidatus Moranbacteria bacterium]
MDRVPKYVFFTKGAGRDKERLASFEAALRNAGIEKFNLVSVSSIFPPKCKIIPAKKGLEMLSPGQIVFCVMARTESNEPNRLIASSIGLAVPTDRSDMYGYLSEHHGYGQKEKIVSDYAEDLAATMLATTLNVEFNPDHAWNEREQLYKASGKIFKTSSITQTAEGDKDGLWTTTIAAAVFVL